eukprot:5077-Heterococcus_DN1.PRE.1
MLDVAGVTHAVANSSTASTQDAAQALTLQEGALASVQVTHQSLTLQQLFALQLTNAPSAYVGYCSSTTYSRYSCMRISVVRRVLVYSKHVIVQKTALDACVEHDAATGCFADSCANSNAQLHCTMRTATEQAELSFAFKRAASRLVEMGSVQYINDWRKRRYAAAAIQAVDSSAA